MTKEDIPDQLFDRLQEEKNQEAIRRKERNEAHMFININVYTEDSFMCHKGMDLINPDKTPCVSFKIPKLGVYLKARDMIAEQMSYPPNSVRLWPFITRNNQSFRPTRVSDDTETCTTFLENATHWGVFAETVSPELPLQSLPVSEKDGKFVSFECLEY